jgi:hypothetical protein
MKSSRSFTDKIVANLFNKLSLLWQRPGFLIGLMTIIYLAVGLLVVTKYSESVDEPPRMLYAESSLDAYFSKIEDLQDEKGPFYGMVALLGSKGLARLIPGWTPIDGWHYMTFVSFVVGVYFFYRLCRRLVDPSPAIAATLLFGTQPLLWGHAFINPKDIPFMAFFLASVSLGLDMVDHMHAQLDASGGKLSLQSELSDLRRELASVWASASGRLRRLLEGLSLLLVALGLSYRLVQVLLAGLVSQAYTAPAASWLGRLFRQTAVYASQVPVQDYISKAHRLYSIIALLTCIGLGLACVCVALLIFSSVRNRLARLLAQPRVLLAGCFLGFCSDIRTLGPASGLLVAVYCLYKSGRKAIPYLLEYLGVGALTIYVFWPYLWNDPFNRFWSSLTEAADFPWAGHIMFAGNIYSQGNQPASYLPVLFTSQFTETAMALILTGIILAGFYLVRRANLRMDMLLLGVWFVAPVAAAILLHSIVYNNFRQFLFVVPPLFVFAGLALQALWNRLKRRGILFVPLVILMLLPGLYWDWQLHPYQYIYYNSLVGGVAGASRVYDTDYWNSAYREALEYVNRVAPEDASVSFWSNKRIAVPYARSDLYLMLLANTQDPGYPLNTLTDYAVITTEDNADQFCFPASKEIFKVQRGGAVLVVVKQVDKGDLIQSENAIQWKEP